MRTIFLGWAAIALLLVITATGGDFTFGQISGMAAVRDEARQFRSEAANTIFSTKNIVPNTNHIYPHPYRAEGDVLLPTTAPRLFSSDEKGAVLPIYRSGDTPIRIVFLGGSTTENNEVDEPFRFPGLVGKILQENGVNAVTLNFGVRGHTSIDSINVLINRYEDLKPHYVVFMHNINDRQRLASSRGYSAIPGRIRATSFDAVAASLAQVCEAVWDFVSYHSNVLFALRFDENLNEAWRSKHNSKEQGTGNISLPNVAESHELGLDGFRRNLAVFASAARAMDVEPILMTQPLGFDDREHDAFNEAIRIFSNQNGITLVDLSAKLVPAAFRTFLADGVHFNNAGSKAAADVVATEVMRILSR